MESPEIQHYHFGPFRIDTGQRLLHRGADLVSLSPKLAETLLVLLQNAGRMVEKTELMKAVWPDSFVEDGALTRNISLLRKTLGDTGDVPVYIETIPKRGYRFIAPLQTPVALEATPLPASTPAPAAAPASPTGLKSIAFAGAVLLVAIAAVTTWLLRQRPFAAPPPVPTAGITLAVIPLRSVDPDPGQDYFADGMTQALITGLARLPNLQVVSLASDRGVPSGQDALNTVLRTRSVHRVLTGTVLRSNGRVRIDAQLVDPATRAVLWANDYERDMKDVIALESTVAEAIAAEIQVNLTTADRERLRQPRVPKPEALDAYLRGRYSWNRRTEDGLKRAAQYFQQAIALDPTYALAYSGLADSYSLLGSIGYDSMPPRQAMPLAKAAAQKALDLDPNLAEAHASLAYVLLSYDWDLPAAAREFTRALALNPNSATAHQWYGHYFMSSADLPQAMAQMRAAVELEPLSPIINIGVGWCFYYSRQFDRAIDQYRSVAEMDPTFAVAHHTLGMAYEQKGMYPQAIEEFKRATAFSGNSPSSVAALASAYAVSGHHAEARQELARLEEMSRTRYVPSFYFASIHHAMGDLGKTFEYGWKAVGERCDYLLYLRVEPQVGRLAGNPEFLRAMAALHR